MHDLLKLVAHVAATALVLPMRLSFGARARLIGRDRALQGSMQALAWMPGVTGICLRRAFLGLVLPRCARTATVECSVAFTSADARLGEHTYIGSFSSIGRADIEDDVLIAGGVQIPSGRHGHRFSEPTRPIRVQGTDKARVRIGRGSWIGAGAIVMADVGANVVVGAGAVVTQPIADRQIAVGVPARPRSY